MIYCIGNSHANTFTKTNPQERYKLNTYDIFASYSLGPVIAYNFYEHHLSKIYSLLDKEIKLTNEDYIMLIVGEVDCRWHLPKIIKEEKRTIKNVVEECIDRFFKCYIKLVSDNIKVICWAGHPTTNRDHSDDKSEPIYGNVIFRNEISLYWNDYLKYKCENNDISFLSIMKYLIDDNGYTRKNFYMDYCHLYYDFISTLIHDELIKINVIK